MATDPYPESIFIDAMPVGQTYPWFRRPPQSGSPRFHELLTELGDLHTIKNSDYANAADPFANFRACEKAGISMVDGIYTRMSDKWERVTNLLKKRRQGDAPAVAGESLIDSLKDLAAYALIEVVALEEADA